MNFFKSSTGQYIDLNYVIFINKYKEKRCFLFDDVIYNIQLIFAGGGETIMSYRNYAIFRSDFKEILKRMMIKDD